MKPTDDSPPETDRGQATVPAVGDGLDELRAELALHGSQQMTPEEADGMQVIFQPRRPTSPVPPDAAPPAPPA